MFQTDKILKYRMSRYCLKVIANGTGSPYGIVHAQGPGASGKKHYNCIAYKPETSQGLFDLRRRHKNYGLR